MMESFNPAATWEALVSSALCSVLLGHCQLPVHRPLQQCLTHAAQ